MYNMLVAKKEEAENVRSRKNDAKGYDINEKRAALRPRLPCVVLPEPRVIRYQIYVWTVSLPVTPPLPLRWEKKLVATALSTGCTVYSVYVSSHHSTDKSLGDVEKV